MSDVSDDEFRQAAWAAWTQTVKDLYMDQFRGRMLTPSCGPGWYSTYLGLFERVQSALSPGEMESFHWTALHDKYGELRAEFVSAPELDGKVELLVQEAGDIAAGICMTCGRPGRMIDRGGWLSVVCERHTPRSATVVEP